MNFLTYLFRRSTLNWQVLLTLALGVLLAVALMASGPVIVDTVLDLGLRRTLVTSDPQEANFLLTTSSDLAVLNYAELNDEVRSLMQSRIGDQLGDIVSSGETSWAYPIVDGDVLSRERMNLRFYGLEWTKISEKATFIAGGLPVDSELGEGVLAGVIPENMANFYELDVGDEIIISSQPNTSAPQLRIQVTGIIKPLEAQDPFWYGSLSPLRSHPDARYNPQYNVLINYNDFFDTAEGLFPSSQVVLSWFAILDPGRVSVRDLPDLQDQIASLTPEVEDLGVGLRVETGLPDLIAEAIPQFEGVRAPLYFLIAAVVLLTLYYVVMAATLSARQGRREFAVLRSRGASASQIIGMQLTEAGIICGVALLSGPGLAILLVRWLVQAGPLADVAHADWVLQVPQAAWLAAIVATIACLASLMGPLPGAVQRSIVSHASTLSRTGRSPWWQRYYVDVIITIVALILLWRLSLYGGILEGTGESARVDWLLLLSPLALLIGAATITLRVFPLLLDLGAALVSRGRGLSGVLALWQAARDPVHVARLVLLLTLAMALGILSSGLNTALDRNEQDRSMYAVGSDVHVVLPESGHSAAGEGTVRNIGTVIDAVPDVSVVTGALRATGSLQMTVANAHPEFDLFAIDPEEFQSVASLREDYAELPISLMLDDLSVQEEEGLAKYQLPGHPSSIGLWLMLPFKGRGEDHPYQYFAESTGFEDFLLKVKLRTVQYETFTLRLYPAGISENQGEGWIYYEAELPPLADSSYPVDLISFWVKKNEEFDFFSGTFLSRLVVDDWTTIDSKTGESIVVEGYETGDQLWYSSDSALSISVERGYSHSGEAHLLIDYWASRIYTTEWIGFFPGEELAESHPVTPPLIQDDQGEEEYLISLPQHPRHVGLWLAFPVMGSYKIGPETSRRVGELADMDVELRLQTSQGENVTLPLGFLETDLVDFTFGEEMPWHFFGAEIPVFSEEDYPLLVSSIGIRFDEQAMVPQIKIDDLILVDAESGETIVGVDFEPTTLYYWILENGEEVGYIDQPERGYQSEQGSWNSIGLRLNFNRMGSIWDVGWVSIKPRETPISTVSTEEESSPSMEESEDLSLATLPVLVSQAFMDVTQVEIGDQVGAWIESRPFHLEVVGVVQYFPTMLEADDAGFVIADNNLLMDAINFVDYLPTSVNEYFISLQPNSSPGTYVNIRNLLGDDVEISDAESLRKTIKSDPLALGLRSVTTLGYILTTVLSLVGFGTYFYVSVRQRRKMYGVLRALGMSPSQLYGTLLLEQLILIFSGLGLGTGLGLLLSVLTLPGLPLSLGGQPPVPPFLAEIEWVEVGRIYLTLAIAFLVSLILATLSLSRARLHRIMRVDEE